MKKVFCVFSGMMILFLEGGCSLFREVVVSRQDSVRTDSRKASLDWQVDSVGWASRVFTYSDSSGAEFEVEIVPLGAFTFSTKAGFTGSARLVRFRGRSQSNSRGVDSSSANTQVSSSGSLKQDVKTKTATTQKQTMKKGNDSIWWVYALLAVLILFVVVICKMKIC